ncbi:MAG: N-6 DNA methylase, partial [Nitrososphaeria archaeon]
MSFGFVEDSVRQYIVECMNNIIRVENLPFERADAQVEIKDTYGRGQRFPDIVLWEKGRVLGKAALLIELKQPKYVPMDVNVVEDAFLKASKIGAPYFATSNIQNLVLFDSFERASLMDRRKGVYRISPSIGHPNDIVRENVRKEIEEGLRAFLLSFSEIYRGIKPLPTLAVDEFFIYNLRWFVDSLSIPLTEALQNEFEKNLEFKKGFQQWFSEQGWTPPLNTKNYYDEFNRAARQYLYLLANKLMFYLVLKLHIPQLPELKIDEAKNGRELKALLQKYFDEAEIESGDYDTIFGMNFIEKFPIPDEIVDSLQMFITNLSKYDFRRLGYTDLGKIFDKLIPSEERHKLGQYFTSQRHKDGSYWPDVVDMILAFTIKSPEATVLDGAVGAGTFLVRSYSRIKYLNPYMSHEDIIGRLYGVDIAKFPALLSAINLAIRDLSAKENYPIIVNKDFFKIVPSGEQNTLRQWANIKQRLLLLTSREEREIPFPLVDAFVGNPPYTRQEEMEDYIPGYKDTLSKIVEREWKLRLGKRCSIYIYFMLHGLKFLKEEGRLGYITSNSWLDVDYGKYLQEILLKNTKIIAIIESKVERWFEDADVNTAITIVEKCSNETERNSNLVKFVQLKKKLEEIIPTTNENERWKALDELVEKIEETNSYYEDERLRIYPKLQQELWNEGYNEEEQAYEGSKWGKYVRAPEIFFKILEKGKGLFVPLKEIAEVRFGIKTGANEFFYLTEEQIQKLGIEREFWMHPVKHDEWFKIREHIPKEDFWIDKGGKYFKSSQYAGIHKIDDVLIDENVIWIPNYLIKSPKECKSIIVDPKALKYRVLMIHKDKKDLKGTNVLKYIEEGEGQGYHKKSTCASRQKWYELTEVSGNLACMMSLSDRFVFWYNNLNSFLDARLYGITFKKNVDDFVLCAVLNSTLSIFFVELFGRVNLGEGALDVKVYEYAQIPIVNLFAINSYKLKRLRESFLKLSKRSIDSIFKELGTNSPQDVSLDKVKTDRITLDKIISEILGLTEEEQLEVYRAVIDLVKSRVEKAKSVERKGNHGQSEIEVLAEDVFREAELSPIPKFPESYIDLLDVKEVKRIPLGTKCEIKATLEGIWLNVDGEMIPCSSYEEAKFLYWAVQAGKEEVPIPSSKEKMAYAVNLFEKEFDERVKVLDSWLEKNIPNQKERKAIREKVIEKMLKS